MIAYHVDRYHLLSVGMQITLQKPNFEGFMAKYMNNLFPEGLSKAGVIFTANCPLNSNTLIQNFREIEFEYLRRICFPDKPSRFQCFFSAKTCKEAFGWIQLFTPSTQLQPIIWKIDVPDDSLELDVAWRDMFATGEHGVNIYSPQSSYEAAYYYWSGQFSDQPKLEIVSPLASGPVRVLEQVSY